MRGIEPTDAPYFFLWNQDSERGRALDFLWPPVSLASVTGWVEKQSQRSLEDDAFHWMIETLEGEAVGTISTHHCDPHTGTFSYGVDIDMNRRRQGYAREAIGLVLKYYFNELRYQKVTVSVHSDNPASILLHETLGFAREGVLRRMIYTRGQYQDEIWFGMTAEEYHQHFPFHKK